MVSLLIMGIFTSALQLGGSGATLDSDVTREVQRQQAICDQIVGNKKKLDQINTLITNINSSKSVSDENDQLISQMSDDIAAFNKNITDLRKAGRQKLLILIIINIIVVAVVSIYIINKVSD